MDRVLLWINISLAVCIAAFAGRVVHTATRSLPGPDLSPLVPVKEKRADNPTRIKPLSAYGVITQRDLFRVGTQGEKDAAPAVNINTLAPTRLKLKLWGTIAGISYRPYAVIEDPKTRQQQLFRVGDTIQGASVKMIMRGKVVLTVEGKDEVLVMEDNANSSSSAQGRPGHGPPVASLPAQPVASRDQGEPPSRQVTLDLKSIQQAMENRDDLQKQIRTRVHLENGQPAGLMLSGIRPDSVFRKMGLRSGDVVTGADDGSMDIDTVADLGTVLDRLASEQAISLEIKRGGRSSRLDIQAE